MVILEKKNDLKLMIEGFTLRRQKSQSQKEDNRERKTIKRKIQSNTEKNQ